ncbi:MAG: hypothetical protein J6X32_04045 [Salinivirgaceae bacterium]|nr:hypothetical protein [Salinivirgaceae bacterium]
MRKITTLVAALLMAVATFAQAPQGFSYQAVVRDAQNAIVANQTVEVTVTILQGATADAAKAVFTEKHSAKTNANGLFTITVGSVDNAEFAKIDWGKGNNFLKTESAYGESTTQLMSVPYALYAEKAASIDAAQLAQTLGNNNDVKAILNLGATTIVNNALAEANYATTANVNSTVNNALASYTTNQKLNDTLAVYAKIVDLPEGVNLTGYAKTDDLATVATTGSYNNLTDKPDLSQYATLTLLQQQIQTLQNQLTQLQNSIPTKLGDLDHTADLSVTVNYVINNDYPATYNTPEDAWVIINGEKVTSTKTFSNLSTSADLVINGKFSAKTLPAGWSYHGYYEIFINGEKWEQLNKIKWGITRNIGSQSNMNNVNYMPAYTTSISDADKADYKVELIGKPTSTCTFNPNHYDYSSYIVTIPCEDLYKNGNCQIVINMYVTAYPTN